MLRRSPRAFTIVELLVVISIIALLIALLLPALGEARESAKTAVCQSNLGHIGKAQLSYAIDNDGYYTMSTEWVWGKGSKYPDGSTIPNGPVRSHRLDPTIVKNIEQGTIYPYHSVVEAFVCPIAVDKLPRQSWWAEEKFVRSYVQNGEAGPSPANSGDTKAWNVSEEQADTLRVPADFVIFNEENTFSIAGWNTHNNVGMNDAYFRQHGGAGSYDQFGSFHDTGTELGSPDGGGYYSQNDELCSGVSYAFLADGHVEEVNYKGRKKTSPYYNQKWSKMWCFDDMPVER